ncbi:uroporphyrinogen-III synthase [Ilumatobacter sp.]|uniref:uroporphyrinogen-III synthase n=1 Tax=Ilumatobacter sp. TaxID=1967498 RepID=UPI003B52B853
MTPPPASAPGLAGCRVVVTRERRGELGRLLEERGAEVVHVALIEVVDLEGDAARPLSDALASAFDWVVVTSAAGAERVGGAVRDRPEVRTAAVGTATARRLAELSGRPVDLVPVRQRGVALVDALVERCPTPQVIVVAQADRADGAVVDGLRRSGHDVRAVTAYRTLGRRPTPSELDAIGGCDAVVFASGSAAVAWCEALGVDALRASPPLAVAIGPTTEAVAASRGLKITATAADHSLAGVVDALEEAWRDRTP